MKKWIRIAGIVAVVVLGIVTIAGVALAQGPNDADKDGVCDVCGQKTGDGLMRGWRLNQDSEQAGQGQPGNGGTCTCGDPTNGQGMRRGGRIAGNADGTRPGWADENGDGICDNCDSATCPYAQEGTRGRMGRWQTQ